MAIWSTQVQYDEIPRAQYLGSVDATGRCYVSVTIAGGAGRLWLRVEEAEQLVHGLEKALVEAAEDPMRPYNIRPDDPSAPLTPGF